MSDKRYEANIIRATAVEPANNLQSTSAPGVWSIDEVVELQKKNKWPTVGNISEDITDVFSTFLYDGNSSARAIENGIKLGNSNDGGSVNFNGVAGATGDWIELPSSADFGYGTGDFTIEFFVYFKTIGVVYTVWDQRTSSQDFNTASILIFVETDGTIRFDTLSSAGSSTGRIEGSVSAGQWYHFALCRSGTSTKMFLNGTQAGSTFSDSTDYVTPASSWSIGGSEEQNQYSSDAYISNVRVVKGTALYTSNFTAPTSALTAVTNTKLLTLQGSTPFVDNSGNSHTITKNNSPLASGFGPFTGTSGEGGLVWIKDRDSGSNSHILYDTQRGAYKGLFSNLTNAEGTRSTGLTAFNSNGFTLGSLGAENSTGNSKVAWTFRKAPKFFDVITWTGDGTSNRTLSHSLNSTPGMIIAKSTSTTTEWMVWHTAMVDNEFLRLNTTGDQGGYGSFYEAGITSTTIGVTSTSANYGMNINNATYVAYIFAHNNNDGGFGPTGSDDIIKCGSYTGNGGSTETGSPLAAIDLGFEPQWLMIKRATGGTGNWLLIDTMRGFDVNIANKPRLLANTIDAEAASASKVPLTNSGFRIEDTDAEINASGATYIYMAIRRGPLSQPTSATDVFKSHLWTGNQTANRDVIGNTNVLTDLVLVSDRDATSSGWSTYAHYMFDRLRGEPKSLSTSSDEDEVSGWNQYHAYDTPTAKGGWGLYGSNSNSGFLNKTGTDYVAHRWQRAPGYFDVVAYTGTGSARTISHNLGVVPEMIWVKRRTGGSAAWQIYHSATGNNQALQLNTSDAVASSTKFNSTDPTSSVFSVGTATSVNRSGDTYIAYLFATLANVSKVGSYTGTGSAINIDCGFTSGARMVIIKCSSHSGNWRIMDSVRGINAGNDPQLYLDTADAEDTNEDVIDPYSAGFSVPASNNDVNQAGRTYIFYAIA